MRPKKSDLRALAKRVLEEKGYVVHDVSSRGVVPGARLKAVKGSKPYQVAVRTSVDREVGFVRDKHWKWRTIRQVDRVVVVALTKDDRKVEVMLFDAATLIKAFDAVVEDRPRTKGDYRLPIFLPLDNRRQKRTGILAPGLKAQAIWRKLISINDNFLRQLVQQELAGGFIERVKREFAELTGVDVSKVEAEFRIIA